MVLAFEFHVVLCGSFKGPVKGLFRCKGQAFLSFTQWKFSRDRSFGEATYVRRWEWGSKFESLESIQVFFSWLGDGVVEFLTIKLKR